MLRLMAVLVGLALGGAGCASAVASEAATGLRLTIDAPEAHAVIGGAEGRVFVAGRAFAVPELSGSFDVIVVIDTSYSTSAPSGADVDGDGRTGQRRFRLISWLIPLANTDPGDSVLAAEVQATKTLLRQLDPAATRVGIVSFSGDARERTRDARTEVPLTSSYEKVLRGLDRLLDEGPHGRTNMYDAMRTAVRELSGTPEAVSQIRPGARKVVLFMTDGHPTLPIPHAPARNGRLVIAAAAGASEEEIRVDTFAIGPAATDDPWVTAEMADVSGGVFTPVRDPRDLIAVFREIDLAQIERVEIRNATTGKPADYVMVEADGGFSAVISLREGENRVEVRAVASNGSTGEVEIPVRLIPMAHSPVLSARLLERRRRLLRDRLDGLRLRSVEMQAQHEAEVRRRLAVEISAEGRAESARKLEISVGKSE